MQNNTEINTLTPDRLIMVTTVMAEKNISLMEACAEIHVNPDGVRNRIWQSKKLIARSKRVQSDYLSNRVSEMNAIVDTEQSIARAWLKCTILMWAAEQRVRSFPGNMGVLA